VKGLRIGRRRARSNELPSSPLELALIPALTDDRWHVPDRFNFTRDVVEALASDPKRRALTHLGKDGVIEPRTFMQISEGAARWATLLREHGVEPEDRVVLLAGSGVDWVEIALGIIKVGAVTVPCPTSISEAALEVRLSTTEAVLVVAEPSTKPVIDAMSFTPEVHYFDEGRMRRSSDAPDRAPTHDTSARDLAFILTTPGTAGASKGVAHTHGSLFATRVAAEHWLDAGRGDAVWCTAPSDSPHAVWSALVGPWSRGAEVVLQQEAFDAFERLDLIYRLAPTILCQTPAEYRALAELRELERFQSPRLRRLVSTGDYLDPEIIATFEERWGMTIHDGYGQAETNIVVANGAEAGVKPGSMGRSLPGHHVGIIDGEGNELPIGIEGDLAVRGRPPTMFAGYWEAPDETKGAFRGDWYVTGDVAIADEDGFLWFVGRAEDVITSHGRTFGPFEVERVLCAHPAITASAVIGLRDLQRGGQFVRAYVVPAGGREGSEQLEAELRQYVGQELPDQQVPREIVFVEELPTIGGNVSRHSLRERPLGGRPLWELPPTTESEPVPPMAPMPTPTPAPVAEAAPVLSPQPPAPPPPAPDSLVVPAPTPEPGLEAAPLRRPEPEQVVTPEPEADADLPPDPEPEPQAISVSEPDAAPVAEAAPALEPEPELEPEPDLEPELEPAHATEPEPVVVHEPEPVAEATPEPEPELDEVPEPSEASPPPEAESEPASEPGHKPEFTIVSEPTVLPDYIIESTSEPARDIQSQPTIEREPIVASAAEPLPDFVVTPEAIVDLHAPPSIPEPEPEPELGPLPDYVVDPNRPPELKPPPPERPETLPPAPFPKVAAETVAEEPVSGLNFPSVVSFPVPRAGADDDDERSRDTPRASRRRPAADQDKGKRGKSGGAEPGDEAEEVSWMQGLSNRLSAYSLSEEDVVSSDDPAADTPEDAETGT
jgi:medium-chain acyl-CoA synthetase